MILQIRGKEKHIFQIQDFPIASKCAEKKCLVLFYFFVEQNFPLRYLWLHRDHVEWLSFRSVAQAYVYKCTQGRNKP